jgi:hypothetical protein
MDHKVEDKTVNKETDKVHRKDKDCSSHNDMIFPFIILSRFKKILWFF